MAPIAGLSLAASIWGVTQLPSLTFYLAPMRAWELLLGSLLALGAFPRSSGRRWNELAGLAGICLIAWAVFSFTSTTQFPGANALIPAAGAALIIYSDGSGATAVARLLGTRPLVFIGLISYSLYLWHWPLLVFAQAWTIHELTTTQKVAIVGASFVLAALSWKFVELPFRRPAGVFPRPPLFAGTAAAMACCAGFGLFGHLSEGWPGHFPARYLEIAGYSNSKNPRQKECLSTWRNWISAEDSCVYGAGVAPA